MEEITHALNWRYATKKFDPTRKVSNDDIKLLLYTIRMSPSSYGLQPFKVLVIEDQELKTRLRPYAWNQAQITECSHLFIFCGFREIPEAAIDALMEAKKIIQGASSEQASNYGNFMKSKLKEFTPDYIRAWAAKQCYLAMGMLLNSCASLKIDSCPLEGFDPKAFDDLLGLEEKNLASSVMVAVGYRSIDDPNSKLAKVRKAEEELFDFF